MAPFARALRFAAAFCVLTAASCAEHHQQQSLKAPQGRRGHKQAALPLPPTLACALAGGWCPADETEQRAPLGSGSSSSDAARRSSLEPMPHKALWPLNANDWAAFGAAAAALLLAASGGIGGGAILVPLYLMVLGFSTARAVALR